jgi:hypothetical protein
MFKQGHYPDFNSKFWSSSSTPSTETKDAIWRHMYTQMKITSIWSNPVFKHQAVSWAIHWFQSKLLFVNLKHTKYNVVRDIQNKKPILKVL